MKKHFLPLCALGLLSLPLTSPLSRPVAARSARVYSPAKGSSERQAIMNAMRRSVKSATGLNVIFVVNHLKASSNGYAFVRTSPTSPDGRTPYEPLAFLLSKGSGRWVVRERLDGTGLNAVGRLRRKYPNAPAGIYR